MCFSICIPCIYIIQDIKHCTNVIRFITELNWSFFLLWHYTCLIIQTINHIYGGPTHTAALLLTLVSYRSFLVEKVNLVHNMAKTEPRKQITRTYEKLFQGLIKVCFDIMERKRTWNSWGDGDYEQ